MHASTAVYILKPQFLPPRMSEEDYMRHCEVSRAVSRQTFDQHELLFLS